MEVQVNGGVEGVAKRSMTVKRGSNVTDLVALGFTLIVETFLPILIGEWCRKKLMGLQFLGCVQVRSGHGMVFVKSVFQL